MITEEMRAAIKKVADLRMLDEREVTFIALAVAPDLIAQGMEKAAEIIGGMAQDGASADWNIACRSCREVIRGEMRAIRASAAQLREGN